MQTLYVKRLASNALKYFLGKELIYIVTVITILGLSSVVWGARNDPGTTRQTKINATVTKKKARLAMLSTSIIFPLREGSALLISTNLKHQVDKCRYLSKSCQELLCPG